MQQIPAHILDSVIQGTNLADGDLRDQLGDQLTLIALLRHLG